MNPGAFGGESGSIFSGVNSAFGAYGLGGSTDTQPAAYLNYILFDQNYKMLTMGWTRVPATPLVKHTLTLADINIKEPGYIFVYLSYESLSNNFVYFDDMKITHTRSKVIQYNEYYPFGMQTANSWTRENNTGNNFLANSGTELNATSNLYDLDYRQYDPVLGRLNGIDPMATKYASLSPYNFSFNDPVTFSDPSGADPYQRSDDTWWVANRQSLYGSKYAGMTRESWQASTMGAFSMSPWDWTGMNPGDIYGPGFGMYGLGNNYVSSLSEQISADAKAVQEGRMNISDYAAKYGSAPTKAIASAMEKSGLFTRNEFGDLGYWRQSGVMVNGVGGIRTWLVKVSKNRSSQAQKGFLYVDKFVPIDSRGGYPPHYVGVFIRVQYISMSGDPEYTDYNWIFNKRFNGGSTIHIDPHNFVNQGPFYYGDEAFWGKDILGSNSIYEYTERAYLDFIGEMTLYGKIGTDWMEIGTVTYGFNFIEGVLTTIAPRITYKEKDRN